MRNEKCEVRNAKCEVRNAKCEMRSVAASRQSPEASQIGNGKWQIKGHFVPIVMLRRERIIY